MEPTHYEILGIDYWADARQITKAYRKLARRFHPDTHVATREERVEEVTAEMASINEARRVLTDPALRRAYDIEIGADTVRALIPSWVPPPPPPGFGIYPHGRVSLGGFQFARAADEMHRALSLIALTTDLSPLEQLWPDGVWRLSAGIGVRITDDDLRHVSGMTSLQVVDLSNTAVTDEGLTHLLPLKRLDDLSFSGLG